jgi:hypothetical protein
MYNKWIEDNVTASQFPSKGRGSYVQWNEDDPEPTGKCLECGEYTYDGKQMCSDIYHNLFVSSLM